MPKRFSPFLLLSIAGLLLACMLSTGYQKKEGAYVYATSDEGQGYVEHPIANVDVKSFRILSKNGYAKDALRVYYHENPVQGADPNSFMSMSDLYGKDNAHIYFEGKAIPSADPTSFALFDIQWGRDSQDVYFQNRPINACDPATFVLLKDGWQRDNQCVYRMGSKLPNAESASFVVLNFWFGKDKKNVYYNSPKIIEGADVASFKLRKGVCSVCAEDKNGCYRYEEPVDCESLK
jgi:hypothetical protein